MKFSFLFLLLFFCKAFCFDENLFNQKLLDSPPIWIEEKLNEDFLFFQKGSITQSMIETYSFPNKIHCKIIDHKFYFYNSTHTSFIPSKMQYPRLKAFYLALKYLTKKQLLPNMEFLISLEDHLSETTPIPILCFAKKKEIFSGICIPDFEALYGYDHLLEDVELAKKRFPFEEKINKAFWRGSTSGTSFTLNTWKVLPRSMLVLFSKNHPDLLDAKFTSIVQTPMQEKDLLKNLLKSNGLLSKNISIFDHLAYKYLIDIDGNSCTYSRLFWILSSNSLCLKQSSDHEQWYYRGIKPYLHYIPFKEDLSDFEKQLQWAQTHQKEVDEIIANANAFAMTYLTQEEAFYYLYCALIRYAIYLS